MTGAVIPSVVLIECLTGQGPRDAVVNAFIKRCTVVDQVPERVARRSASLRTQAGRGSAVDALVVALAEPGGTVFTTDAPDIRALAAHALHVSVERVSTRPVR